MSRRPRTVTTPLAVALAVTLGVAAGCDPTDPVPYEPTVQLDGSTPLPQQTFCAALAQNVCAVLRPCCQASPYAFDEARCHAVSRALCEARRSKAHDQGLTYDDELAAKCVDGTPGLVSRCLFVSPTDDPIAAEVAYACRMVFHGDRRIGEACDASSLSPCAPPASGAKVTCSGICLAIQEKKGGEACQTVDLDAGTSCFAPGCVCGPGLDCNGVPPRCTARVLVEDAPCDLLGTCGACTAERCLTCACANGVRSTPCFDEGAPTSPRCRPLPGSGQSCTSETGCAYGLRCDTDHGSVCVDGKALGAVCTADTDCASRHCQGICLPAGIADPINCNGAFPGGSGGLVGVPTPVTK